jgi:site-specific DNA recombinase
MTGTTASMAALRAVVYSRVSTDAQERDGTSLETQERACVEHARALGWDIVATFRDTASGYTLDRPGLDQVRRLVHDGLVEAVVAYAVDRLSRNQNHIGVVFDDAQKSDVRLEFVTEKFEDTAIGRFILAARAFIAEVEREKIAERTMRGKAERARSGRIPQGTGKGCYGYRYNPSTGKREIVPEQAEVVRRIFREVLEGVPIMTIAERLNDDGIPTFSGGFWFPATIHHMLRNPTYTGRMIYRKTVVRQFHDRLSGRRRRKVELRDEADWIEVVGATPVIVDEATFQGVQEILDDPERLRRGRRDNPYPLSGHLRCRRCGKAMVGQTLQKRFRYYRCRRAFAGPRHDRCDGTYVRADDLEQVVREQVARILADPQLIEAEYRRREAASLDPTAIADLERQLESLETQRSRLLKLYQLGEIDDAYLEAESRGLRARRALIEGRLARLRAVRLELDLEELERACSRVREWLRHTGPEDLRLIASALQLKIEMETGFGDLTGVVPSGDDYAQASGDADVRAVVSNSAFAESARPLGK